MKLITFIHISDLHYQRDLDQDKVIGAFLNDIEKIKKEKGLNPDFVIFSGDLVQAGNKYTDFTNSEKNFISPLMARLDLDHSKFFFVPGNHDIDRDKIDEFAEIGLEKSLSDREIVNDFLDDIKKYKSHLTRLNNFNKFRKHFTGNNNLPLLYSTHTFIYDAFNIGVACLNTSWRVTGKKTEKDESYDYGKLLIGERQINNAYKEIQACDIKIAVFHHPLEWLQEFERNANELDLTKNFDFILHGHNHKNIPKLAQSIYGKTIISNTGCLYSKREYFNGYSIIQYEHKEKATFYIRTYFDQREEFDDAVNIVSSGVKEFILSDNKHNNLSISETKRKQDGATIKITIDHARKRYDSWSKDRFVNLKNISEVILSSFSQVDINALDDGKLFPITTEDAEGKKSSLYEHIQEMIHNKERHLLLIGEGGMGKTTALWHLFKKLTHDPKSGNKSRPFVPLYLDLQMINSADEGELYINWIVNRVLRFYHYNLEGELSETPYNEDINQVENVLFKMTNVIPDFILLLDGYNEVTNNKEKLLRHLERLLSRKNIFIVVTTRCHLNDERDAKILFENFKIFQLTGVGEKEIIQYLEDRELIYPEQLKKNRLLANPMYLSLYAGMEVPLTVNNTYHFLHNIETEGEILHNFFEYGKVKWDDHHRNQNLWKKDEIRLCIDILLPYLGYIMERDGKYEIERKNMFDILYDRLDTMLKDENELLSLKNDYDIVLSNIHQSYEEHHEKTSLFVEYFCEKILVENLHFLKRNESTEKFGFIHQDFRDFFAAVYVKNNIDLFLKNEVSDIDNLSFIRDINISYNVKRFLGDIYQEYKNKLQYITNDTHDCKKTKTTLDKLLDFFRGKYLDDNDSIGNIIYNILGIFIIADKDLTTYNFCDLNINILEIYKVKLGRSTNSRGAVFCNNEICEKQIFPLFESAPVLTGAYSPDGKKILSAGFDGIIKEWDVESGRCIQVFIGHDDRVNCAWYTKKGDKIISACYNGIIKEWMVKTGECLRTINAHQYSVTSISFSDDDKLIISAGWDNMIKIWDADSWELLHTISGYVRSGALNGIKLAIFLDEKRVLSCGWEHIIREWDIETGKCIGEYRGHAHNIKSLTLSHDKSKLLSASLDGTIRKWSTESKMCEMIYDEHEAGVISVAFSPDDTRFISAGFDNIIKEWNISDSKSINTMHGHLAGINCVRYSHAGKVVSASEDMTIREWSKDKRKCLTVLPNIDGLYIQGTDFSYATMQVTGKKLYFMYLYGAKLSVNDERRALEYKDTWIDEMIKGDINE